MNRQQIKLYLVPFDYTDSATWVNATNVGHILTNGRQINQKKNKFVKATGIDKLAQYEYNYKNFQKVQERYYIKWKKECND